MLEVVWDLECSIQMIMKWVFFECFVEDIDKIVDWVLGNVFCYVIQSVIEI